MTPEELVDLILHESFTPTSAMRYLRLLKERVSDKLFQATEEAGQSEYQLASVREKQWLDNLPIDLFNRFNQNSLHNIFTRAEENIKSIQPLIIFLAFELPETEISTLGAYLRQDFGSHFLIELRINPYLIAGAAFSWKGIYKDYSLQQKISDNHQAILKVLEEYRHKK